MVINGRKIKKQVVDILGKFLCMSKEEAIKEGKKIERELKKTDPKQYTAIKRFERDLKESASRVLGISKKDIKIRPACKDIGLKW